jgi:hypothetical protein
MTRDEIQEQRPAVAMSRQVQGQRTPDDCKDYGKQHFPKHARLNAQSLLQQSAS